jgi:hypothetical protein
MKSVLKSVLDTAQDDIPVEYDPKGRMLFHPGFHPNQGKPFSAEEEKYLIDFYSITGAAEMSLALGRRVNNISQKVANLRKAGRMPPAKPEGSA